MSSLLLSPESLTHVIQTLQTQIVSQQTLLAENNESYKRFENQTTASDKPKKHKLDKYDGKKACHQLHDSHGNYLDDASDSDSLPLAGSYLTGAAHEWCIDFKKSGDGQLLQTRKDVKNALVSRFDTLSKEKIARDELTRWRQVRDIPTFNNYSQRILLEIPDISEEEQLDHYRGAITSYIWNKHCKKRL